MVTAQLLALLIFVALFALGAIRGVHIGVLMIAGAAGTGLLLAHMKLADIIAGFPLDIMVLLVGVTYFFAIAQTNGTIDKLIDRALTKVGSNAFALPVVFFLLTLGIAAMGAPLAGLVMMPVGMQVARRYNIDFALMGLAICFAIGAGGFAPTSLYGIVTYGTAHKAGIGLNPLLLFGIALATYVLLLAAAYFMFWRRSARTANLHLHSPDLAHAGPAGNHPFERETALTRGGASTSSAQFGEGDDEAAYGEAFAAADADRAAAGTSVVSEPATGRPAGDTAAGERAGELAGAESRPAGTAAQAPAAPGAPADSRFTGVQILTIVFIVGLIAAVVALAALGKKPDVGILCFAFGAALTLIDPGTGKDAIGKIDWSTVLLVGGIITFVGVLQQMGAVDLLGEGAKAIGSPLVAALVLCAVGGLVSAFASTTGILAALVPLALPMIADGHLPGWALIAALGVCSAVVDVSPFSTLGATVVATAPDSAKPRLIRILTTFGMSMVVVGPILLVGALVLPAMLLGG